MKSTPAWQQSSRTRSVTGWGSPTTRKRPNFLLQGRHETRRSREMQALLGIDIGTTGVKAALFAANDGHVLSSAFVDYPLFHPQPGWAEQDPEQWWRATIAAISSCLSK